LDIEEMTRKNRNGMAGAVLLMSLACAYNMLKSTQGVLITPGFINSASHSASCGLQEDMRTVDDNQPQRFDCALNDCNGRQKLNLDQSNNLLRILVVQEGPPASPEEREMEGE
jgi:hypothetical protein